MGKYPQSAFFKMGMCIQLKIRPIFPLIMKEVN